MSLKIPTDCLHRMMAHAAGGAPEEVCGLLGGILGQAQAVYPITNSEHSPTRFRMEPKEQLAALLDMADRGWEIVAIYHSHPNGPHFPSETDLKEFAYPGVITLIWSPNTDGTAAPGSMGAASAWRVDGFSVEDGQFSTIELQFEARVD